MSNWEVLLDTTNGTLTRTIAADGFDVEEMGISFYEKQEDNSTKEVAFFPFTKLAGCRQLPVAS